MSDISARQSYVRHMMASIEATAGRATVGAGHLHTPEEKVYDSFTQGNEQVTFGTKLAPVKTLSPPISPENAILPSFASTASTASHSTRDEVLFPENTQGDSQAPLFNTQSQQSESQSRNDSPPSTPLKRLHVTTSPTLATVPGTQIQVERSPEGAKAYYDSCMASLESTRYAQRSAGTLPFPQRSSAQPRDPVSSRQLNMLLTNPAGVTKSRKSTMTMKMASPMKSIVKPKTPKITPMRAATPEMGAAPTRRSRTPHKRAVSELHNDAFPGDHEKKHKRAAPSKQTPSKESDLHWRDMQDYAPPLSSLNDSPNRLKAVWPSGTAPLDIHDDADAHCLDPVEMEVAATLRLKPVQYLSNKRRIFEAKLQSLKDNKTFTKTAAQSACNIDVNKASALWMAFDKVGWFERKWFEDWL